MVRLQTRWFWVRIPWESHVFEGVTLLYIFVLSVVNGGDWTSSLSSSSSTSKYHFIVRLCFLLLKWQVVSTPKCPWGMVLFTKILSTFFIFFIKFPVKLSAYSTGFDFNRLDWLFLSHLLWNIPYKVRFINIPFLPIILLVLLFHLHFIFLNPLEALFVYYRSLLSVFHLYHTLWVTVKSRL